ncbi:MAG: hypothetical protein RLY78_4064, partial [Pseudomonadota bacterium]
MSLSSIATVGRHTLAALGRLTLRGLGGRRGMPARLLWGILLSMGLLGSLSLGAWLIWAKGIVPNLDRLRPQAEQALTSALGRPVRIAALHADDHGPGLPTLQVRGLSIDAPDGRAGLRLTQARLQLGLHPLATWRLWRERTLMLSALELQGLTVHQWRSADGHRWLAGFDLDAPGAPALSAAQALETLLEQPRLSLRDARLLLWTATDAQPTPLALREAGLVREGRRHRLWLETGSVDGKDRPAPTAAAGAPPGPDLTLQWTPRRGDPALAWWAGEGTLVLRADSPRLTDDLRRLRQLLQAWRAAPTDPDPLRDLDGLDGRLRTMVTLQWSAGRWDQLGADIDARGLRLPPALGCRTPPCRIGALGGRWQLTQQTDGVALPAATGSGPVRLPAPALPAASAATAAPALAQAPTAALTDRLRPPADWLLPPTAARWRLSGQDLRWTGADSPGWQDGRLRLDLSLSAEATAATATA